MLYSVLLQPVRDGAVLKGLLSTRSCTAPPCHCKTLIILWGPHYHTIVLCAGIRYIEEESYPGQLSNRNPLLPAAAQSTTS